MAPFWFLAPPSGFWPLLLLHPGDGPACTPPKDDIQVNLIWKNHHKVSQPKQLKPNFPRVSQIMTKSKTFTLKQNLTCANCGIYAATCGICHEHACWPNYSSNKFHIHFLSTFSITTACCFRQTCSHGGHSGAVPPNFVAPKFCCVQTIF